MNNYNLQAEVIVEMNTDEVPGKQLDHNDLNIGVCQINIEPESSELTNTGNNPF